MDDMLLLAQGKMLTETNNQVKDYDDKEWRWAGVVSHGSM